MSNRVVIRAATRRSNEPRPRNLGDGTGAMPRVDEPIRGTPPRPGLGDAGGPEDAGDRSVPEPKAAGSWPLRRGRRWWWVIGIGAALVAIAAAVALAVR